MKIKLGECLTIENSYITEASLYDNNSPFNYMLTFENHYCIDPNKTLSCYSNYLDAIVEKCEFPNTSLNHPDKLVPLQKMLELFCDVNENKFSKFALEKGNHYFHDRISNKIEVEVMSEFHIF